MGFYGNISNINKTNFVFDRIYTNRAAMERAQAAVHKEAGDNTEMGDGVFIGRYVLVEYGEIDTNKSFIRAYREKRNGAYVENNPWFYLVETLPTEGADDLIIKYTNNLTSVKNNYVTNGIIIYTIEDNVYTYYECVDIIDNNSKKPKFKKIQLNTIQSDPYWYNMQQDLKYGHSRGYDGTVWMKTTIAETDSDGNEKIVPKYVNIAELNTVVPTFEMVADAPTLSPLAPHFDTSSTNVYYKLHWQPAWGMRIAQAEVQEDGTTVYSDYITEWTQETYNSDGSVTTKWYNPKTQAWQTKSDNNTKIEADIYFNRAAFDAQIGVGRADIKKKNTKVSDYIGITADGKSGNTYNKHDQTSVQEQKADTQQIHINLPAIGNMMSDAWDIIHGTDRDDYKGEWKKKADGSYEMNSDGTRKDFSSLKGRLDSISAIATNQIPIKRLDTGELVGTTINGASKYVDADGLEGQIKSNTDFSDDAWVQTHVDATQTPNAISVHHTYHTTDNTVSSLDKNTGEQILDDAFKDGKNKEKLEKIPVLNKQDAETGKEDTIKLYTPYVDATGHVVGKNIETITLPYGFKTITAENFVLEEGETETQWSQDTIENKHSAASEGENVLDIVADNTKDTFNFKGGNKWIRFQTDAENKAGSTNELDPGSGNNTLTIAHETHDITTTALGNDYNTVYTEVSLSDIEYESGKYYYEKSDGKYELDCAKEITENRKYYNRSINNNIIVQDLQFDIAGHVTHNQPHTYTLPYGYKTVVTGGLNENEQKDLYTSIVLGKNGAADTSTATATHSYSEADNTQDTMNIEPYNKWIQTKLSDDKLEIAHEIHAIDTVSAGTSNQNEETDANNENNINIPDWTYDKAGHITAKKDHFYTLPFGYKQVVAANDTVENVELSTVDNSLIANNTQDVLNIKAANNWIKLNTVDTADNPNEISFSHKLVSVDESGTYIGGTYHSYTYTDLENNTTHDQKPQFGETANILNVTVDNAGHVIGFGTNAITIPIGSYTPANSTSDSTEIITSIGFTSKSGAITSTKASTGTLQLDDSYSNVYILVGKIEQTEFSTLKHYIYKDNEYKAATGWSAEQDYYITKDNYVAPGDSINDAFYKLQTQIKDIYGNSKIADSFDTIKEIADFLEQDDNGKQSGIETIISNISANTAAIGAEELRAKGAESTLTTNLNNEINRAKGAENTLTTNLSGEITRATDAESALDTRITNLVGDTTVSAQITAAFSDTLGSAAYKNESDFATAVQGTKADSAIQLKKDYVYNIIKVTDPDTGEVLTTTEEKTNLYALTNLVYELQDQIAALQTEIKTLKGE